MKPIWTAVSLALLLGACSSTPMQPKDAENEVMSKDDSSTTMVKDNANEAASNAVTSVDVDANASKPMMNELHDPASILSQRQVFFDYDSDAIKSEHTILIQSHAKYLQGHPNAKIVLQGNTDERGTREYNLSLGQRRAVSVKNTMNLLGINDNQIETVSYGEERAKQNCSNDSCFQYDRRVDIVYEGE